MQNDLKLNHEAETWLDTFDQSEIDSGLADRITTEFEKHRNASKTVEFIVNESKNITELTWYILSFGGYVQALKR